MSDGLNSALSAAYAKSGRAGVHAAFLQVFDIVAEKNHTPPLPLESLNALAEGATDGWLKDNEVVRRFVVDGGGEVVS